MTPKPVALMAYDDHPGYRGWRPLVQEAWKRLGWEPVFLHVTTGAPDPGAIHVPPSDGVSTAAYAKFSRLWWTQNERFAGRVVALSDLDMVPLAQHHFALLANIPEGHFVAGGGDFFQVGAHHPIGNYFPSCYCSAEQATWHEILGPIGDMPRWLLLDDRNNDEPFIKLALELWNQQARILVMPRWAQHPNSRLCKSEWKFDEAGLRSGKYIDVHLPQFGTVPEEQVTVIREVIRA